MAAEVIRACQNCRYVLNLIPKGELRGQLMCRFGPPAVLGLPMQQGRNVTVAMQAADRPVSPKYWCHQFVLREMPVKADAGGYLPSDPELAPMDEESGNAVS